MRSDRDVLVFFAAFAAKESEKFVSFSWHARFVVCARAVFRLNQAKSPAWL
jgi:hypothetical protein